MRAAINHTEMATFLPKRSAMASFDPQQVFSSSGKGKQKKRGSGVKLSTDPQSVAARERRHRISHRFKILQSLVPGGSKMDTVSMLEEAIHYVKFLQTQIMLHQNAVASVVPPPTSVFYASEQESFINGGATEFGSQFQGFGCSLPPLPPLPARPGCVFPDESLLHWASSLDNYSL